MPRFKESSSVSISSALQTSPQVSEPEPLPSRPRSTTNTRLLTVDDLTVADEADAPAGEAP